MWSDIARCLRQFLEVTGMSMPSQEVVLPVSLVLGVAALALLRYRHKPR